MPNTNTTVQQCISKLEHYVSYVFYFLKNMNAFNFSIRSIRGHR